MLRAAQKASELHIRYNFLCVGVLWNDSQRENCQWFLLGNIMQQPGSWRRARGRPANSRRDEALVPVRGPEHCAHCRPGTTAVFSMAFEQTAQLENTISHSSSSLHAAQHWSGRRATYAPLNSTYFTSLRSSFWRARLRLAEHRQVPTTMQCH